MKDRNDEAGSNRLQQTNNGGTEPNEIPTSNVEMDNHTPEPQKSVNLKSALEDRDLSRIDQILRESPSLVYRPLDGKSKETPLHVACRKQWRDGVMHLLNRRDIGKSFDQEDAQGFLPLHRAIDGNLGYGDILKPLIKGLNPSDLNSTTNDNDTAIHLAAGVGNAAVLEKLCRMLPKDVIDSRNNAGDIPLHLAVRNGHLEAVKTLLAADRSDGTIPILYRDGNQDTPIHVAVRQGQPKILEELLKEWNYKELVIFDNYELRDGGGKAPLHIVAELDIEEEKAVELLLQILARCTEPDLLNEVEPSIGWTPLHFAASRGHAWIAKLLLANGADNRKTDELGFSAAEVARRENHVETADLISRFDRRSFRPGLEIDGNNVKVDDNFLALSWPKWDKAVQQQRRAPTRLWPQLTPVHQLIFNTNDTYHKAQSIDRGREESVTVTFGRPGKESAETAEAGIMLEAIELAPMHQAQIRLSSCVNEGWIMEEKSNYQKTHILEKVMDAHTQSKKRASQIYLYESSVLQDKDRSTRWIHFPANNRDWIEDLCRCMYSHGSLRSEVIGILRFIEDCFQEVEGSQKYWYRKHGFISQLLEKITDPPPKEPLIYSGGHDTAEHPEATSRHEPAATESGYAKQPEDKYSAYSIVFPLLDIDMIDPGFRYPLDPGIENRYTDPQRSPTETSSQRASRMSSLSHDLAPLMGANRQKVQNRWANNMDTLRQKKRVHLSRSLDHYCHQQVSGKELQKRVQDQVLTRFMKRRLGQEMSPTENSESSPLRAFLRLCSNVVKKLRSSITESRDLLRPTLSLEEGLEGGIRARETAGITTRLNAALSPWQILVVPQLWLWKFDNLVITAFPERWGTDHRNALLDAIRERVEYLDVDREVQPNRLVTEILNACAEFKPTLDVGEQRHTWTDAFDDEILSVIHIIVLSGLQHGPKSRDIKDCYSHFEGNLGMSAEKFSKQFVTPTKCLRSIDDVLDELTSIKRIFQDQIQVWEKVHSGDNSCAVCRGIEYSREDERGEEPEENPKKDREICVPNVLPKRSLELVVRLEEDALKVRESASISFVASHGRLLPALTA
ncbi:hypothetical protein J7T55_013939 [Diaporthe amygdali]|uniref:uncharacterized protein n=1 Tax=Phomopsis amygdali TaxID=1214568 RepID=UPI0022FEA444|nr:uncharacterized protein J7T55_013939 [Diaporthe amygdali]KAJ0119736.1 hypothetical protein J7T55_013939 [Diaporthe amygdali]